MGSSTTRFQGPVGIIVLLLSYFIVSTVLLSPQFSLSGGISPDGLIRIDQVAIPFGVVVLALLCRDNVRLPVNRVTCGLLLVNFSIVSSLVANSILSGLIPELGNIFNILIWLTYTLMFLIIGGNLSEDVSNRSFVLTIGLTIVIGVFALLQASGTSLAVETIGSIYTNHEPYRIVLSPTATTTSPNTLGIIFIIPLFACLALFYRSAMRTGTRPNIPQILIWGFLSAVFGGLIILTDARSALAATVAGLPLVIVGVLQARIGSDRRRKFLVSGTLFFMLIAIILSIFVLEIGRVAYLQNPFQDQSLMQRIEKWPILFQMILERPIIGHGPGNLFVNTGTETLYFDSGFLSWWYQYGLVGVAGYLYFALGVVRLGYRGLTDIELFERSAFLWGAAVAITGWFSGTLVAWIFVTVPQNRRAFTLALLTAAFVLSHYCNNYQTGTD